MVVVFHGHDFLQWWYFMGQIFHGSGISWAWLSIKMIFNWHGFPWGGLLWAQFSTGVVFSWGDLPWGWSLNSCSAALQKDRQGRWTLTHRTVCWQPACLHRHGEPSRDTLASVPPSVGTALPPTSLPPADTNKYHTPQTLDMDKYTTENHQAAFTARLRSPPPQYIHGILSHATFFSGVSGQSPCPKGCGIQFHSSASASMAKQRCPDHQT